MELIPVSAAFEGLFRPNDAYARGSDARSSRLVPCGAAGTQADGDRRTQT